MAEEQPSLHIDTDWKKQAQEEKKRLAEEQKQPVVAASSPAAESAGSATGDRGVGGSAGRGRGELPPATLGTLVQSILTQVLFYLGELAPRGSQPQVNLDMAKHNIDLLTVLEEKTASNLTDDEKRLLDAALYETRMRYVSVASQYT
jgi:hypothetical protein